VYTSSIKSSSSSLRARVFERGAERLKKKKCKLFDVFIITTGGKKSKKSLCPVFDRNTRRETKFHEHREYTRAINYRLHASFSIGNYRSRVHIISARTHISLLSYIMLCVREYVRVL